MWPYIPYHINPVLFSLGSIQIHWYSLGYLMSFSTVFLLINFRLKKDFHFLPTKILKSKEKLFNILCWIIFGLLIGARVGYVLFYNFQYFLDNPISIVSPIDTSGKFIGIQGMSFHGGAIGAVVAGLACAKKNNLSFWELSDFIVPAIPLAYFWGRIGNFLAGELYGRPTKSFLGMYFPSDPGNKLRHPSQIYEALGEGILIFIILWPLRNNAKLKNKFLPLYLILYGLIRFLIEFFRQPDAQIGFVLSFFTLGQILCLLMIFIGLLSNALLKFFSGSDVKEL